MLMARITLRNVNRRDLPGAVAIALRSLEPFPFR
jgi:hypothetical protein